MMPSHDFILGAGIGAFATLFACTYLFLHLMVPVLKDATENHRLASADLDRALALLGEDEEAPPS